MLKGTPCANYLTVFDFYYVLKFSVILKFYIHQQCRYKLNPKTAFSLAYCLLAARPSILIIMSNKPFIILNYLHAIKYALHYSNSS
jgi:hypothetical protein